MCVFGWRFYFRFQFCFASVTLRATQQHHLPNGYYIHQPCVGMEVKMTLLLLRNVVCERTMGSPRWSDPYARYFYDKAKADSSNGYIRLQKLIWFLWQETGFTLLFRVIRIKPPLTIMPFDSHLKISYFLSQRNRGLSLQI